MKAHELEQTARMLAGPSKGILAADESTGTIEKRLKSVNVPALEETRRSYREVLFTTPGLGKFISGVILFDETLRQKTTDGTPFVELLQHQGIIPGIKVDKGAKPLANFPGEKVTEGLDGLRDRLAAYCEAGVRFTKWRAVLTIGADRPSSTCLEANAQALARFAALSQEAGLVPIVEPEVLMDGDHTIDRCSEVTESTLHAVFRALHDHRITLEGILLKPNMVSAGSACAELAGVAEVAEATVDCLRRVVPVAVPGVTFLSGGQSEILATQHLNAMNQRSSPWELSFSYGRALQNSALQSWRGEPANIRAAQNALYHRARCNSAARSGEYGDQIEREITVESGG